MRKISMGLDTLQLKYTVHDVLPCQVVGEMRTTNSQLAIGLAPQQTSHVHITTKSILR